MVVALDGLEIVYSYPISVTRILQDPIGKRYLVIAYLVKSYFLNDSRNEVMKADFCLTVKNIFDVMSLVEIWTIVSEVSRLPISLKSDLAIIRVENIVRRIENVVV